MTRFFVISVFVLICGSNINAEASRITVDIYYESLCGDSIKFFKEQLMPSYPGLKDYLNINFVPYGKASTKLDESKKYTFTCQHGPDECQGNKAHVCGYDAILDLNTTFAEKQSLAVNVIGCAMSSNNSESAVPTCAETAGLNEETRKIIDDCIKSDHGDALLAAYGDRTHGLKPPLKFVPTIVIDGMYFDENQNLAISDFKKFICDRTPEDKPAACSK